MGELGNLHSGSSGNVDAIHEKNSQGGSTFKEVDITAAWEAGTQGDIPNEQLDLSEWDKTKPLFCYIEYKHLTVAKDSEFWFELLNLNTGVSVFDMFNMKVAIGETFTKVWRVDGIIQDDATVVSINPNFEESLQKVTLYQWA